MLALSEFLGYLMFCLSYTVQICLCANSRMTVQSMLAHHRECHHSSAVPLSRIENGVRWHRLWSPSDSPRTYTHPLKYGFTCM